MQRAGFDVEALPYDAWHARLAALAQEAPGELIGPLMSVLGQGGGIEPGRHPRYDCTRATALLAGSGIVCPAADEALLATCHSFLQRTGALSN